MIPQNNLMAHVGQSSFSSVLTIYQSINLTIYLSVYGLYVSHQNLSTLNAGKVTPKR